MAKKEAVVGSILAALLAGVLPAVAQGDTSKAQVQTVVTVVPKGSNDATVDQNTIRVRADGKDSAITDWTPLRGDRAGLKRGQDRGGERYGDKSSAIHSVIPRE